MGVVRNGETLDGKVAKLEGGSRIENLPVRLVLELGLHGFRRHEIRIHGGIILLDECRNAGRMVAMLVSDEYHIDFLGRDSAVVEHLANSLAAESDIDERFAILSDEQSAIAGAATAEDRELHGHRMSSVAFRERISNKKSRISKTPQSGSAKAIRSPGA